MSEALSRELPTTSARLSPTTSAGDSPVGLRIGNSPFPEIVERTPIGSLTVGWGNGAQANGTSAFKRRSSASMMPNLLSKPGKPPTSEELHVPLTPLTLDAFSEPSTMTDADIDASISNVIQDQRGVQSALSALQALQHASAAPGVPPGVSAPIYVPATRPRRLSHERDSFPVIEARARRLSRERDTDGSLSPALSDASTRLRRLSVERDELTCSPAMPAPVPCARSLSVEPDLGTFECELAALHEDVEGLAESAAAAKAEMLSTARPRRLSRERDDRASPGTQLDAARARRASAESRDSLSPEMTPPAQWRQYGSQPPARISTEWEAEVRHAHASRLLTASAKASKKAARKMLAMASNEALRTSAMPPSFAPCDPEAYDAPNSSASPNTSPHTSRPKVVSPRAVSMSSPYLPPTEASLELHRARMEALPPSKGDEWHVVTRQPVSDAGPWQCFVHGLHAVLGCDAGLR